MFYISRILYVEVLWYYIWPTSHGEKKKGHSDPNSDSHKKFSKSRRIYYIFFLQSNLIMEKTSGILLVHQSLYHISRAFVRMWDRRLASMWNHREIDYFWISYIVYTGTRFQIFSSSQRLATGLLSSQDSIFVAYFEKCSYWWTRSEKCKTTQFFIDCP